jgi:glycyl-tRNA synthetase
MENLYDSNGLVFWTEDEIRLRRMFEQHILSAITSNLKTQNRGFEFFQVEAPLITPRVFINKNYTDEDMWTLDDRFVLRPETTMGSYQAILDLLSPHNPRKVKPPLVVWQHGKSFRREQDQPTKFMRLKEFYQLEFQIAYGLSTANDYSVELIPAVQKAIADLIGPCRTEPSDRLPDYAESTTDIICIKSDMEVCSISKRKDLSGLKVLEVAVGTDRCVYNFQNK